MSTLSDRISLSNAGKLPDMLRLRYALMAENVFRFYRGTCTLFYEDLSKASFPQSPAAWISGDLHLENFGAFKGSNRLVYFDLNDFDESLLAPAAWEVVRLVTSILVAFDGLEISEEKAMKAASLCLSAYSETLAAGKAVYIEPQVARGIVRDFLLEASRKKAKDLLKKSTERSGRRLVVEDDDPKHEDLDPATKQDLMDHMSQWIKGSPGKLRKYRVRDVGFRIAGTGGVGQARYMFLLQKKTDKSDYLLVDMKQALPSSLVPFSPFTQPVWQSEAQRIVSAQAWMQNIPPAHLSATIYKNEPFILQELQPVKDSINFELIRKQYRDMCEVIKSMAVLTASAQLRSSGRQGSANVDELIAFGGRSDWQEEVLAYARAYARQTRLDYRQFVKDRKAGLPALV